MEYLSSFEKFYESVNNLGEKLKNIDDKLDQKRKELRSEVEDFNRLIQSYKIEKKFSKNEKIYESLNSTINSIKNSANNWEKKFNELLENEKFRSKLANYFILVIYGKVKAGKSTLGNFIANNSKFEKAKFFKYDEAGKKHNTKELKEINEKNFKTDLLEATKEIQGFFLGGLAWVDTPGIHSMTKENEELAKKYIDAADFIIFPTSSDSPLQEDEINELKNLFDYDKKVTLCITKSDKVIEDECECGSESGCEKCNEGIIKVTINKSQEDREKQEKEIYERLTEVVKDKENLLGEIISISTYTAKIGLDDNNEELFLNSNMPKFYDMIREILEKKADSLKGYAPFKQLKSFIEKDVKSDLQNIKNELNNTQNEIEKIYKKLDKINSNIKNEINSIIDEIVEKYHLEISKENYKEIFKKIDKEIEEQFKEKTNENIKEIFKDFEASFKNLIVSLNSDEFEIKNVYETIKVSNKEKFKKIGQSIGAVVGAIGYVSGPVIGTITSAAGALIGDKIGEFISDYDEKTIFVGDNKEEIIMKFKESRVDFFEKMSIEVYNNIRNDFFKPLESFLDKIKQDIEHFKNKLISIKESL